MGFLRIKRLFLVPAAFLLSTVPVIAQDTPVGVVGTQVATQETPEAATNSEQLRKAAQNPIASLISLPVQENFNFGIEPADRTQNVVNIQPVIPFSLSSNWNLIVRWIAPVIYQPLPVPQPPGPPAQQTGVSGLGDMNPSFFLSPKKSKVIWGVGTTLVLPTATNTAYLGQGKLSMGPTIVALVQPTHFTIGFLANNYWSIAYHSNFDKPAVNQFLLQWFVNYNMKKGWYVVTAPIITANWRATGDNVWIVPFGGGVGRYHESWIPAGKYQRTVLWQRFPSPGSVAMGHEVTSCVPVPEVKQRAKEGAIGEGTETDGIAATAEVKASSWISQWGNTYGRHSWKPREP